jgi:hypothetical protein
MVGGTGVLTCAAQAEACGSGKPQGGSQFL